MKQRHRFTDGEARTPGPRPPLQVDDARQQVLDAKTRAVILVEGWSDQAALQTLATTRGHDLAAERIAVLPMGGITNFDKFAQALGPGGLKLRLAGLYDAAEERHVRRGLQRLGLAPTAPTREEMEALGFFVCEADLEDELIRALGSAAVEQVLDAQGELISFRRFQEQPAQRGRPVQMHLHRFMGTRALRKIRYGALLTAALQPGQVPKPLDQVLRHLLT